MIPVEDMGAAQFVGTLILFGVLVFIIVWALFF